MKEFIEKLIGRLEEEQKKQQYLFNNVLNNDNQRMVHAYAEQCYLYMTEIVSQLAGEHRFNPSLIDGIKAFLKMKFEYCAEQAEIWRNSSDKDAYFREQKDLYMDRANIYGEVMREIDRLAEEYNNGWIPCSERLPEDGQEVLIWYEDGHCEGREVATFQRGKTKEELFAMPLLSFSFEDQMGNNLKPYAWFGDGPMQWFGQDVLAWQPLPPDYQPKGE